MRSIEPFTMIAHQRRRTLATEWTLGLGIPLLVAGPIFQSRRFQVIEGFGCTNSIDSSILSILLLKSWFVLPPLVSIGFYYPRVVRIFYRHSRDMNDFLASNNSVSRTNYFRILALASLDSLVTLPIGVAIIVLAVQDTLSVNISFPSYYIRPFNHADWQPDSVSHSSIVTGGAFDAAQFYFSNWISPVLAFIIFVLFGVTSEARASYWHIIHTACGWFGRKPTPLTRRARSPLGDIEFGERPPQNSMSLGLNSRPSFINPNVSVQDQGGEMGGAINRVEDCSEKDAIEGVHQDRVQGTVNPARPSESHQADSNSAETVV
ncbi:unnamed protein product [Peniophora sp. CBMAI 1063]|nr:unnamed protein product [Peniophora sp. CBMAI 1063]